MDGVSVIIRRLIARLWGWSGISSVDDIFQLRYVRLWHKADMLNALTNVRFWGKADIVQPLPTNLDL